MSEDEPTPGDHHVELDFADPLEAFEFAPADSPPALTRNDDTGLLSVTAPVVAVGGGPEDPVVGIALGGDVILLDAPTTTARGLTAGIRISFQVASADICPFSP